LVGRYVPGHGVAAMLWLASAVTPAPARFWLWAIAFAIDLGTPWTALAHSVRTPPDAAHLPERFGLFTLILLGEAVVAVMQGIESQEAWPPAAVASAFLGMSFVFLIWSWYFDGIAAASEQPVRSRRDAWRFHIWSYAHFPLALGIVVAGVGVQRIVTAAARQSLPFGEGVILTGAAALVMVAMTTIAAALARPGHRSAKRIVLHLVLAAATFACGAAGVLSVPVTAIVVTAIANAAQLAISLQSPSSFRRVPNGVASGGLVVRLP
jgi:low temperature requirement protein LtrA